MEIRRVRPEEWRELRDTRLRALRESPDAFVTRYDDARERPDEWWIDWAERSAAGDGQAMFLAWEDGRPVGIVGTFVDNGRRWLIAMWTDPCLRRQGVGRRLVEAIVAFAPREDVYLHVRHTNHGARALYERCGFVETGRDDVDATMRRSS